MYNREPERKFALRASCRQISIKTDKRTYKYRDERMTSQRNGRNREKKGVEEWEGRRVGSGLMRVTMWVFAPAFFPQFLLTSGSDSEVWALGL